MHGIVFAIIAGVFITLQTVFNTRVSEKVGSWATTTLVLGVGLLTSLPIFLVMENTNLFALGNINKVYLLGGVMGVGIVFSIMQAIRLLGPAYAISIVLVSQLTIAVLIDTFGWFGFETIPFTLNKMIGLGLMIAGIIVYKLKNSYEQHAQMEKKSLIEVSGD